MCRHTPAIDALRTEFQFSVGGLQQSIVAWHLERVCRKAVRSVLVVGFLCCSVLELAVVSHKGFKVVFVRLGFRSH